MADSKHTPMAHLPPQNLEAEKSVLGALLLDKEAINKVIDFLKPEDFYTRAHQIIFDLIEKWRAAHAPVAVNGKG